MPAPRVAPRTVFTPEEWQALSRRDDAIGLGLVAHAWVLIAGASALFALWPNPLTWLIAIMTVGGRQLGLAILMHEAAHGGLCRNQRLNDFVGQWLCAAPVGAGLADYRPYHLRHHRDTQQPDDPDLGLAAHFPVSRASLRRKLIRDITGQTFVKQRLGPLFARLRRGRANRSTDLRDAKGLAAYVGANAAVFALYAAAGQPWLFLSVWMVAQATWFPLVTRVRNIGEHACATPDPGDPWRLARTVRANPLERLLVAPYWVHFHAEHHLWMHVPCYRLAETHRLLAAKGLTDRMEVRTGYLDVLRIATGRAPAA